MSASRGKGGSYAWPENKLMARLMGRWVGIAKAGAGWAQLWTASDGFLCAVNDKIVQSKNYFRRTYVRTSAFFMIP